MGHTTQLTLRSRFRRFAALLSVACLGLLATAAQGQTFREFPMEGQVMSLVRAPDGYLYGLVNRYIANGWQINMFRMSPEGVMTYPVAGNFYNNNYNHGLSLGSDGSCYWNNSQDIFKMSAAGALRKLHSFSSTGYQISRLIQAKDGYLYGTRNADGVKPATIFKLSPTGVFKSLYSFTSSDGSSPSIGGLLQASDGNLYGTCTGGGENGAGTVYRITTAGAFTRLASFSLTHGTHTASLVQGNDGHLYGMTPGGGTYSRGCVFRVKVFASEALISILHSFEGSTTISSESGLVRASDGSMFGMSKGNTAIFKVSTSGVITHVSSFSDPRFGSYPHLSSPLIPAGDGSFYGHTYYSIVQVFPPTIPLVLQNQTDRQVALQNVYVYTPSVASSKSITPTLPANWRVAAHGDFDRDGEWDVVVQNTVTRAISVLYMDGHTVWSSASLSPVLPANWEVVGSADFNGDGMRDLVAQNVSTQQVSVLTVVGARITGSFALSQKLAAGWRVVGVGDFSGDSLPDLVAQNPTTRQISILTLNWITVTGSASVLPQLPANWLVGGVSDYDGDGSPDLFAQNGATMQISVLKVVNKKITASIPITPAPQAGWKLVGPR